VTDAIIRAFGERRRHYFVYFRARLASYEHGSAMAMSQESRYLRARRRMGAVLDLINVLSASLARRPTFHDDISAARSKVLIN